MLILIPKSVQTKPNPLKTHRHYLLVGGASNFLLASSHRILARSTIKDTFLA